MNLYNVLASVTLLKIVCCHVVLDLSSSNWNVYENTNRTIVTHGAVPGGVYSMLEDKAMISDILYGNNDLNYRWVGSYAWTYYRDFELNATHLAYPSLNLILHGIDTLAEVFVNSQHVLSCDNMFVRHTADVKKILVEGENNITIIFESPISGAEQIASRLGYTVPPVCHPPSYNGECNVNMLRKMQASFSWDWGPAFPSTGVWKPVEIAMSEGPVIRSVGVSTAVEGVYWRLNMSVWFDTTNMKLKDTLFVELSHPKSGVVLVTAKKFNLNSKIGEEEVNLSVLVAKTKVDVWWPNGFGEQNLYNLRVYSTHSEKKMQIGFRTIELVQENVSKDEKQGKTFYFTVNGVKMFAKGSNWIPSHVLPERLSDSARIVPLLEAAAESHFNMLRVWGGGVYESDLFYETCDRLGILVWQDLMFACSLYPVSTQFLKSVEEEVKQQVQRLQHHPSIAIWAGNNENEAALAQNWYTSDNFTGYKSDYIKLYVDTIKPIVTNLDKTRKYLTSSPSNGVETVEEGYVSKNPGNTLYGDVHYYNYLSNGWDHRIYPNPRFASEYGVQSLPTARCLRSALPLGEMKWGSTFIEHRQHSPGGNTILTSRISDNLPISNDINDIIYLSQINQAMSMKVESEKYRRLKSVLLDSGEGYTMGALYWQLNDIWQAPSWASIDYCGHWKMLQYFAKDFFAPIIVPPELSPDRNKISVYVVIDGKSQYSQGNVTLNVHSWSAGNWSPVKQFTSVKTLVDNESFEVFQIPLSDAVKGGKKEDYFFTTSLDVNGNAIAPDNFLLMSSFKDKIPESSVKISDYILVDSQTAELSLSAEKYALFVWLDLNGLDGTFSKNGFHMFQPSTKIIFKSKYPLDKSSLRKITVTWLKKSY